MACPFIDSPEIFKDYILPVITTCAGAFFGAAGGYYFQIKLSKNAERRKALYHFVEQYNNIRDYIDDAGNAKIPRLEETPDFVAIYQVKNNFNQFDRDFHNIYKMILENLNETELAQDIKSVIDKTESVIDAIIEVRECIAKDITAHREAIYESKDWYNGHNEKLYYDTKKRLNKAVY